MTGELVLQQIAALESEGQFAQRLAAALAKQGVQRLIEARDAFEDEGGTITSWKEAGRRWCRLVLGGECVALISSDQTSADAEAHAFQNLYNDRSNAAKGKAK